MKEEQWVDIYVNGWMIGSLWGVGSLQYDSMLPCLGKYRLTMNDTDTYLWIDGIKRRKESVEPIKQEAVSVGV